MFYWATDCKYSYFCLVVLLSYVCTLFYFYLSRILNKLEMRGRAYRVARAA